jgi:hypothetical protein
MAPRKTEQLREQSQTTNRIVREIINREVILTSERTAPLRELRLEEEARDPSKKYRDSWSQ